MWDPSRYTLEKLEAHRTHVFPPTERSVEDPPAEADQDLPVAPGNCSANDEYSTYAALWIDVKDCSKYLSYCVKRLLCLRPSPPIYLGEMQRAERAERDRMDRQLLAEGAKQRAFDEETKRARMMVE